MTIWTFAHSSQAISLPHTTYIKKRLAFCIAGLNTEFLTKLTTFSKQKRVRVRGEREKREERRKGEEEVESSPFFSPKPCLSCT